jgi:hypothetical protein
MAPRLKKIDNEWKFKDEPFKMTYEEILENKYFGFIYLIEEHSTGMNYVGQKCFHSFRTPKGKKNKKKIESDWKIYGSSNKGLAAKVKISELEKNNKYTFTMLAITQDKSSLNYSEVRWMMIANALGSDKWYNDNLKLNIMCTIKDLELRVIEDSSRFSMLQAIV